MSERERAREKDREQERERESKKEKAKESERQRDRERGTKHSSLKLRRLHSLDGATEPYIPNQITPRYSSLRAGSWLPGAALLLLLCSDVVPASRHLHPIAHCSFPIRDSKRI